MSKASEKLKTEKALRTSRLGRRWLVLMAIIAIAGVTLLITASSKRLETVVGPGLSVPPAVAGGSTSAQGALLSKDLPATAGGTDKSGSAHTALRTFDTVSNAPGTSAAQTSVEPPLGRRPVFTYQVVKSRPHDPGAYTQGLVYRDGLLYESTGLTGQSSLRKVELETGQVLTKIDIPSPYFAEGLAIFNDRVIQLTWQHHIGFVYQLANFQALQNFSYTGEGWGLTHDTQSLIMSDGTSEIRFLDPQTFQVRRIIKVRDGFSEVIRLNELEYIDGEIWANVWLTDRIVRISPDSGKVNSTIDLTGLLPPADRPGADVLNGIAFDAAGRRLFLTGKLWPKLFEVKITTKRSPAHR